MSQNKENVKQHSWGYELIWANTENYCGKILYFTEKNSKTPFYFNSETDKTFFVSSGSFKIRWISTNDGQVFETEVNEGQVWHCPKLQPCSLHALVAESSMNVVCEGNKTDTHVILRAENF
jgi:hypothetical protein